MKDNRGREAPRGDLRKTPGRGDVALRLLRKLHFRPGDHAGGGGREAADCGMWMENGTCQGKNTKALTTKRKSRDPQRTGKLLVHLRTGVNGRACKLTEDIARAVHFRKIKTSFH